MKNHTEGTSDPGLRNTDIGPKDSKCLNKNVEGMDDKVKPNESSFNLHELSSTSQSSEENQVKGKPIVFDESPESSNMDCGHKYQNNKDENGINSEDVYCTASSQIDFESFLQPKSEGQRSSQENKRLETDSEKLRKEYRVREQRLGQFEREVLKLQEEKETLQKERIGGKCDQGIILEEQRASLEAKKSDLGSQNSPEHLESVELSENVDQLQKHHNKMAVEHQVPKKQIEEIQQALEESECQNFLSRNKQEKWVEEHDVSNTRSKTLEVELANVQQKKQKLRRELSAKATDLKHLQVMFSSLVKEKEIIAKELALKVRILADTEEDLNDLKEQNMTLTNKLEAYGREHKSKTRQVQGTLSLLQNRNKILADQLLKSSEGCRALKRKLKELQETNKGLKREIVNLKSSIQNQEKSTHVLESERKALQNELTWGKERLHILQEKCKCFKEETETVIKEDLSKLNRQKNFSDEIVLVEQFLLQFKEEMTCFKAESERRDKECLELKEEIAMLQTEVSYLHLENDSLKQGRSNKEIPKKQSANNYESENGIPITTNSTENGPIKSVDKECKQLSNEVQEIAQQKENGSLLLNNLARNLKQENQHVECQLHYMCSEDKGANRRNGSIEEQLLHLDNTNTNLEEQTLSRNSNIKRLKYASDMAVCEKENDQAQMSDERDLKIQVSGKSSVIQNESGASSMEQGKKVLVSGINSLINQIMSLHQVVNDLKISILYSSEVPLTNHDNLHGLDVVVKELGRANSNLQNERGVLDTHDQELYKQLVGSKQFLEEIEHHISRMAYETDGRVLDVSHKTASISELEKQLGSLQKETLAKTDKINLWVSLGRQGKKKRIEVEHQDRVEQITQLEDQIRKLQKESDGLKQENMNLKAECQKKRENCSFLEKCLQYLQQELSKANENVKLKEKGHVILQEENSWIKNSISEAVAITQTVGQEIQVLEAKKSTLQNELPIKAEEYGKLNEELQKQLDELQRENLLLNNASKADGSRKHELQSEVEKLDIQVKMLRDENEKQRIILSDRAEEKRDAISQLRFTLDHLKDRNTHLQRILSSILNYNRNNASSTPTTAF